MGRRVYVALTALLLAFPLLTACREMPVPLATPVVGECHLYGGAGASSAFETSMPVSCTEPHTAETIAVRPSGLPEPDSHGTWTDRQIHDVGVRYCDENVHARALGISRGKLSTLRVSESFFAPAPKQALAGARWLRCDVLVFADDAPVVTTERQADQVSIDGAFARCTDDPPGFPTEALRCVPGSSSFAAVTSVLAGAAGSPYPAGLPATVRAACAKALPSVAEPTMTRLSWTSTVPTRPEWKSGDTSGICWLRVEDWQVDSSAWPAEKAFASQS